jgi:hypothetical protein
VQSDALLAQKLSYRVNETEENCQWLNYVLAQMICRYRMSRHVQVLLLDHLHNTLNPSDRSEFLGPIALTAFSLGDGYPRLDNARVVSKSASSAFDGLVTAFDSLLMLLAGY